MAQMLMGAGGALPGSIGEDAPNASAIPKVRFWANLRSGKVVELKEMLAAGFDPNTISGEGIYPIHQAIYFDDGEIIDLLIAHKADLSRKDSKGYTPLILAAVLGKPEAVAKLLKHSAGNINAQDNLGATALIHSVQNDRLLITQMLLQAGALKNITDYSGRQARFYAKKSRNASMGDLFR